MIAHQRGDASIDIIAEGGANPTWMYRHLPQPRYAQAPFPSSPARQLGAKNGIQGRAGLSQVLTRNLQIRGDVIQL